MNTSPLSSRSFSVLGRLFALALGVSALAPGLARADARDDYQGAPQVKLEALNYAVRDRMLSGTPVCITKSVGGLDLTVGSSDLGLPDPMNRPIVLHGSQEGGDRTLLRYEVDTSFEPRVDMPTGSAAGTAHINRLHGWLVLRLVSEANDDAACGSGRFNVRFEHVRSDVRVGGNVDALNIGFDEPLSIGSLFGFGGDRHDPVPPPPPALARLTVDHPTLCETTRDTRLWGEVTLSGPAPAGGYVVALTDTSEQISEPATVTVAAGRQSARFAVDVAGDFEGLATLTASGAGAADRSVQIQEAPYWTCRMPEKLRMIRDLIGECLACSELRLDRFGEVIRSNGGLAERSLGGEFATIAALPAGARVRASSATTLVGTFFDKGERGFALRQGEEGVQLEVLDASVPVAANDRGDLAGYALDGKGQTVGFVQIDGASKALPTLGGAWTMPSALTAEGAVIGASQRKDGSVHAFVWRDGKMTDVGDLGGGMSAAVGASDDGAVVGSSMSSKGLERGFVFDGKGIRDLGSLDTFDSVRVEGVTAGGLLYGRAYDSAKGLDSARPFVGTADGGLKDASGLAEGAEIRAILGANDAGDLVADALLDGKPARVLLSVAQEKGF